MIAVLVANTDKELHLGEADMLVDADAVRRAEADFVHLQGYRKTCQR
jgi:hypothetical protein